MSQKPHHLPTASLAMLKLRGVILRAIRNFFDDHDFFEVETPLLSHDIVVDLWLEPFRTTFETSSRSASYTQEMFLQTSPEFGMKRLLTAGAKAIYQITRSFRNGEVGTLHNPEFTILEWYRVGDDCFDQMRFIELLIRNVFDVAKAFIKEHSAEFPMQLPPHALTEETFDQLTYDNAFQQSTGTKVLHLETSELFELAIQQQVTKPESTSNFDRDQLLNLLLAELVEPHLGKEHPLFLYDYPASQAALAQVRDEVPPVAERFELYLKGIEICNGYHELTDADQFLKRTKEQSLLRVQAGLPTLPVENHLHSAMQAGLPASCGVALGVDRLIMLATGAREIQEVIAFPFDRA